MTFIFPEILGIINHPNWRIHIFWEGVKPPTSESVFCSCWATARDQFWKNWLVLFCCVFFGILKRDLFQWTVKHYQILSLNLQQDLSGMFWDHQQLLGLSSHSSWDVAGTDETTEASAQLAVFVHGAQVGRCWRSGVSEIMVAQFRKKSLGSTGWWRATCSIASIMDFYWFLISSYF